jgi:hypothetical protein
MEAYLPIEGPNHAQTHRIWRRWAESNRRTGLCRRKNGVHGVTLRSGNRRSQSIWVRLRPWRFGGSRGIHAAWNKTPQARHPGNRAVPCRAMPNKAILTPVSMKCAERHSPDARAREAVHGDLGDLPNGGLEPPRPRGHQPQDGFGTFVHLPICVHSPQGGVRDRPSDKAFGVHPGPAGDQPNEHGLKTDPVGDSRSVTAQGMGPVRRWEQGFHRCPHGIYHFDFECAHDVSDLHLVVGWIALRIKSEPSRRPVDGHLSARRLRAEGHDSGAGAEYPCQRTLGPIDLRS